MESAPAGDLDMSVDVEDIGGNPDAIDVADTTDVYREVDEAMESNDNDAVDVHDSGDHEMTAIMDILQTLGVDVE